MIEQPESMIPNSAQYNQMVCRISTESEHIHANTLFGIPKTHTCEGVRAGSRPVGTTGDTMPYAKLTITVPDAVWIGELSRAYPETRFRVLAATADAATGVARIEITGEEPVAVCEDIRDYDTVTELTVFESDDRIRRVQVETTVPLLMTSLQNSGVPLEMPFEVCDGEMAFEATIPQQNLSKLGETLDEMGISYRVDRIQQDVESDPLLTDRQQWLLDEAIERGYYDTPRRTTLVDLADELDIAKSTCSEILHRAEERVLKEYIGDEREARPTVALSSD